MKTKVYNTEAETPNDIYRTYIYGGHEKGTKTVLDLLCFYDPEVLFKGKDGANDAVFQGAIADLVVKEEAMLASCLGKDRIVLDGIRMGGGNLCRDSHVAVRYSLEEPVAGLRRKLECRQDLSAAYLGLAGDQVLLEAVLDKAGQLAGRQFLFGILPRNRLADYATNENSSPAMFVLKQADYLRGGNELEREIAYVNLKTLANNNPMADPVVTELMGLARDRSITDTDYKKESEVLAYSVEDVFDLMND